MLRWYLATRESVCLLGSKDGSMGPGVLFETGSDGVYKGDIGVKDRARCWMLKNEARYDWDRCGKMFRLGRNDF